MRFLVDAHLPPALCRWLQQHGHEAVHVNDVLPIPASDRVIAACAEREGLAVISKDEDLVVLRAPDRYAMVWTRCGNVSNRALVAWLTPKSLELERRLADGERLIELR